MKKLPLLLLLLFIISSCATFHSVPFFLESPIKDNINYKYIRNISGKSQATYILGIGGLLREGLVREAKNNLLNNNTILDGQHLVNFTIDKEDSYYFGVVVTNRIIVSADVVEFQKLNSKSNKNIEKIIVNKNSQPISEENSQPISEENLEKLEKRKNELKKLLKFKAISKEEYNNSIRKLDQMKQ